MNMISKLFSIVIFSIFCTMIAIGQPKKTPFSTNPFSENPITNPFGGDDKKDKNKKEKTKDEKKDKKDPNSEDADKKDANAEDADKKEGDASDAENYFNSNKESSEGLETEKNGENSTENSTSNNENNDKNRNNSNTKVTDKPKSKVYGFDYFSSGDFSQSDKSFTAPPGDFRLGVGDEIIISIYGASQKQIPVTIGRDGAINPMYVGKIFLQGVTYDNAKSIIANKYRSVVAAGSSIDVQVGKVRSIRITFIGEVQHNGTITVSAFTTAINALALAGGLTPLGNMRRIEILRNNRVAKTIDLYEFIKQGGNLEELYLEDGDVINVGTYEKMVSAKGSFRRPMFYQLKEDENLNNLIDLAGGPTFDARFSSVQVKSVINEQPRILTVNLKDINNNNSTYVLFDGDEVNIKKVTPNFNNTVEVKGAVNYPQFYEVKEGDKLSTIIKKAGGLENEAFTSRAYLYRGDDNFVIEASKIDLNDLMKGKIENDIAVLPGDRIEVISKKDFVNSYFIEIFGSVKTPRKIPYVKNFRLKDALIACGGLTPEAENGRIEIASIVDSITTFEMKLKNKVAVRNLLINPNLELDQASEEIILGPMDKIFIRTKPDFHLLYTINMAGEVNYPGQYAIKDDNEKLSSFLQRCGGVRATADLRGARLQRDSIGDIFLDLEGLTKYMNAKVNPYDIILKNKDVIIVPTKNELVTIKGTVIKPLSLFGNAEPTPLLEYINSAGGFGDRPWKDRISVTYPNGKIKTVKRIFFIRKYPKVEQGCMVTVPKKPEKKDWQFSWKDAGAFSGSVLSAIAALTTAYAILKRP